MFEQAFKNIDDVLRKEAGCTTELDYTEQTSWLLFLKYLDGLEQDKADEAALEGKKYTYILDKPYRWETWAAPKDKDGKLDHNKALTGDDLRDFVNEQALSRTCTASSRRPAARTRSNTRSARSSARSRTRSRAATTCARSSTTSTSCASARRPRSTSSRTSTKPRSRTWATPGATAASTTRRARSSAPSSRWSQPKIGETHLRRRVSARPASCASPSTTCKAKHRSSPPTGPEDASGAHLLRQGEEVASPTSSRS